MTNARWFKSSYSNANANCVEVCHFAEETGVRDSKNNGIGPVLTFSLAAWTAFVDGVRGGEFDNP
ncbi:DUF397 domain-containing protein [Nocardia sp. NPDC050697]|uniref:DUF397 domain-containing protein n=1 Tax=Nocardia sp. NPDC050697 TaxID=3155158 RepID=UPI0033E6D9AD